MNLKDFKLDNVVHYIYKNKFIALFLIFMLNLPILSKNIGLSWIIVSLALFTSVVNNSFQIFGTFFLINKKTPKLKMFLFILIIFILTIFFSWIFCNHQIHFEKLNSIPYSNNLMLSSFLAPFVLMLLTYKKIPVSTTFLFVSLFSSTDVLHSIVSKTLHMYILAFLIGFILWKYIYPVIMKYLNRYVDLNKANENIKFWFVLQYFSTALLWFAWLFSNMSSVLVFAPREFSIKDLILLFILAGFVIYYLVDNMGGSMQHIVKNKQGTSNVKSATIINIIYGILIYIFQFEVNIPISTTWVFIGLMGGREFAITSNSNIAIISSIAQKNAVKKIILDFLYATIGVIISLSFVYIVKFIGI